MQIHGFLHKGSNTDTDYGMTTYFWFSENTYTYLSISKYLLHANSTQVNVVGSMEIQGRKRHTPLPGEESIPVEEGETFAYESGCTSYGYRSPVSAK